MSFQLKSEINQHGGVKKQYILRAKKLEKIMIGKIVEIKKKDEGGIYFTKRLKIYSKLLKIEGNYLFYKVVSLKVHIYIVLSVKNL